MITKKVQMLIDELGLQPHPEGGYYSETFRSEITLPGTERQIMTAIYFLLTPENPSNFHRIKSDELWFYHDGEPLSVHLLDEEGHREYKLGLNLLKGERPQLTVPAGKIFGSSVESEKGYSLVSCVVAPGFDFNDFELFDRNYLSEQFPNCTEIIRKLTPDH